MTTDDKDKAIFDQNCEDFRSLNEIMWKIPIIVITLTGGLWFGVGTMNIADQAKTSLLLLAGIANLTFIVVLFRLRYVMNIILKEIKRYQGLQPSKAYVFVFLFSGLLLFSAGVSLYAAYSGTVFYKPKDVKETNTAKPQVTKPGMPDKGN